MSLIAKMYVEDKEINILDFKFRFTRAVNEHGFPMGKPRGTIFEIIFETTSDQSFMAWSVATDMTKHVKIVVSPVTATSKSRIIELYDVHCVHFKNNFNGQNGEPMTTLVHLTPAIMIDDGYKIVNHYWKKTDLDAKAPVTTLNDDQEPSIMFLDWIHEDTDESLSEVSYGSGASLKVQVNNPKGNEAKISVQKEDGSDFENGKKELIATAFLDGNGFGKISTLNFLGKWASENEELDFDNLIAYVEHAGIKKSSPKLKVKKPKVKFEWQNPTDGTRLEEVDYGERVNLALEVKDGKEGACVEVKITKKDGTEFESGMKERVFDVKLDATGKAVVKDILMEKIWMDTNHTDTDCLIARASVDGIMSNKKSKALDLIRLPEVIVDFRPAKDYNGEFGFDYMRDTHKKDFVSYEEILGSYITKNGVDEFNKDKTTARGVQYHSLKNNVLGFIRLQDQRTDEQGNDVGNPVTWYKDEVGNEKEYIQSYLAMYSGDTIDLSVQVETLAHGNDLTIEYDTTLFRLNTSIIPKNGGRKRIDKHLQLTCLQEFSDEKHLTVKYKDRTLGQLNILPNDKSHRFRKDVVFVKVKTNLTGTGRFKEGDSTDEDILLRRYLRQAFIRLDLAPTINLDLRNDNTFNTSFADTRNGLINRTNGIHAYLAGKISAQYNNYLKVYFIDEECPKIENGVKIGLVVGKAESFSAKDVIIFKGHNKKTTSHETMHAMGLRHPFDNASTYIFEKNHTQNIMDYSHNVGIDCIYTWQWQWQILQPSALPE
ncbi:type VI secretion system tube protein TssD [Bernardetia sp. Wsw4-3y2]|uniref:type VI secretion system tube protein TssD n=1 Tax=Bernardetia sp. Wsw4-3y2 TaxID=3127471 RepID=UPI0030CB11D8